MTQSEAAHSLLHVDGHDGAHPFLLAVFLGNFSRCETVGSSFPRGSARGLGAGSSALPLCDNLDVLPSVDWTRFSLAMASVKRRTFRASGKFFSIGDDEIGIMRALNRGHVGEFDSSRKDHHWGRRKLARDR